MFGELGLLLVKIFYQFYTGTFKSSHKINDISNVD